LLFLLELQFDLRYHLVQFLNWRVLSLPLGFIVAFLALHKDDVLVGLVRVVGVTLPIKQLKLLLGCGEQGLVVAFAEMGGFDAFRLSFLHRNYMILNIIVNPQ
jgi:hypothetical protein